MADVERGREWVAIILAFGFATAINTITFAVLYDAIVNHARAGLSENATQVLIAGFGAMAGLLGAYLGARAVTAGARFNQDSDRTPAKVGEPGSDP